MNIKAQGYREKCRLEGQQPKSRELRTKTEQRRVPGKKISF